MARRGRHITRSHYTRPRNEHDDEMSGSITSDRSGDYFDCNSNTRKLFPKSYSCGDNRLRPSRNSNQFNDEFSRIGHSQRVFPKKNQTRCNTLKNSFFLKENHTGWYLILILCNEDYDETLKLIQTYIAPVVFFPYDKQFVNGALRFVVDDFEVAKKLRNISCKITLSSGYKLVTKVSPHVPSFESISCTPVSENVKKKMMMAMESRYNPVMKTLDLSKFYACPLFTEAQLFVSLNHPAVLLAALTIVAHYTKNELYGLSLENNHIYLGQGLMWIRRLFPNLKVLDLAGNKLTSFNELKSLSGFTIEVLNLSRNPVSETENQEHYIQKVQQYFPSINKLDNLELQSRYSATAGSKLKILINLDNSYPQLNGHNPEQPNTLVTLVESFLTEFYELYDSQLTRQMVGKMYHENTTFSMSSGYLSNYAKGNLLHYLNKSQNILKSSRNKFCYKMFEQKGRENVLLFLNMLPKTKHNLDSFIVDVPLANSAMIQIVVNGVFAENFQETARRHTFKSFCRTIFLVSNENVWKILNDMLFVTNVNEELYLESSKQYHKYKQNQISKNDYADGDLNTTVLREDGTSKLESSSFQQPNIHLSISSQFQHTPFLSNLSSAPFMNQQPLLSCSNNFQTSIMENQHSNFLKQNNFGLPSVTSAFSTSSVPASSVPACSVPAPVSGNLIGNTKIDFNYENLIMIERFSNDSGMNIEWARKCLEENNWDYVKAASCFSKLKTSIPSAAFIH